MKNLLIISFFLFFSTVGAQVTKENSLFPKASSKNKFTNSFLANATKQVKTTLDVYNVGYFYKAPTVEYKVTPNPVNTGDYITITPVKLGDVVHIYEPTGMFKQSQVIGIDKKINTINLEKGEYILKTKTAILNLIVQ